MEIVAIILVTVVGLYLVVKGFSSAKSGNKEINEWLTGDRDD
ncbi:MAG TPA: hypothetical protein VJ583_03455 [Nitrososphaeraceae archaeon]|nr:hypothetical protein [Nitrososphaeraceae archaeon]